LGCLALDRPNRQPRGYDVDISSSGRRLTTPIAPTETVKRLTPGLTIVVITGLSALSWAVWIAVVLALRALL
jgi:hypothetical protein